MRIKTKDSRDSSMERRNREFEDRVKNEGKNKLCHCN